MRWRSSTGRLDELARLISNRRATSTPTAAGRSPGSSSLASTKANTASPKCSPRPRTPALRAWWMRGFWPQGGGKVRLLKPEELPPDWNPTTDPRLTAWEMVHQGFFEGADLVRALEAGGESAAAELAAPLWAASRPRRLASCATACTRYASARNVLAAEAALLQQPGAELARDQDTRLTAIAKQELEGSHEKYRKIDGSRAVGLHLSPDGNRSHSFTVFVSGLRRLVQSCAGG